MKWWTTAAVLWGCGNGGGGSVSHDARSADSADVLDSEELADASNDAAVPVVAPPRGDCEHQWCWVLPYPQVYPTIAFAGTGDSDVWIGADGYGQTRAHHYDGSDWTTYDNVNAQHLYAAATNDVWAGGDIGLFHWNGSSWAFSMGVPIAALGGTGPHDVWAANSYTSTLLHWDGATWTTVPGISTGFRAVAFGGVASSWLVSSGGDVANWDGAMWKTAGRATGLTRAASVIDDSHVVVAQYNNVQFWDGATWTAHTPPVAGDWTTIAAGSFNDVTIGGVIGQGVFAHLHWNGTSWATLGEPSSAPGRPWSLWLSPSGTVWAGFDDGEVFASNGSSWSTKTVGDNRVRDVWGTAENDIWVVSDYASAGWDQTLRAQHWDGTSWIEFALPSNAHDRLGKIWSRASDDVWIAAGRRVNTNTERYLFHWNGTTWTSIGPLGSEPNGPYSGFTSVWGSSANDVYAVAKTSVYHFDGSSWSNVAAVPGGTDVFGTGSNDVYICNDTKLWHWDGATWTAVTAPISITSGAAHSPSDVWLGGQGAVTHYDGMSFAPAQPIQNSVTRFFGTSDDMIALTGGGYVTRWIGGFGGTKTQLSPPISAGGWRTPKGDLYLAGGGLVVLGP